MLFNCTYLDTKIHITSIPKLKLNIQCYKFPVLNAMIGSFLFFANLLYIWLDNGKQHFQI
jgi:hypothetical protein